MVYHQIIVTSLQGNVKQLDGRINNQIMGVKGFKAVNIHFGFETQIACVLAIVHSSRICKACKNLPTSDFILVQHTSF